MTATATAPAWAKGFDVAQLKQISKVFKIAHKRWAMGPFSIPNDSAVAEALSRGGCFVVQSGGDALACAIWKRTTTKRATNDFTGTEHVIPPGHVVVGDFAAFSADSGVEVLAPLLQGDSLWVKIFQEDRVSRAVMDRLGFVLAFVQIGAASDIFGYYTRDAALASKFALCESYSLRIIQENFISTAERAEIISEVAGAADFWAQHYSNYNKRKSWQAFALRGYQPDDPRNIIKPAEMARAWKDDHPGWQTWKCATTVIANRFPTANAVADRLPFAKDRVRLMKLRPGGELTRHADITDREAGLRDGLVARLHIPLVTNSKVVMSGWDSDGRRIDMHWPERALCYLDQRKPHCVVNGDPKLERIHFVIDCHSTATLRDWLSV